MQEFFHPEELMQMVVGCQDYDFRELEKVTYISQTEKQTNKQTKEAFLLHNPASDLGYPGRLDFYFSWDKNPKKKKKERNKREIDPICFIHHPRASLRRASVCLCVGSKQPRAIDLKLVRQLERTIFNQS